MSTRPAIKYSPEMIDALIKAHIKSTLNFEGDIEIEYYHRRKQKLFEATAHLGQEQSVDDLVDVVKDVPNINETTDAPCDPVDPSEEIPEKNQDENPKDDNPEKTQEEINEEMGVDEDDFEDAFEDPEPELETEELEGKDSDSMFPLDDEETETAEETAEPSEDDDEDIFGDD